ncbi:putative fungal-specific transcription factor [Aspergillus heterothallicus]
MMTATGTPPTPCLVRIAPAPTTDTPGQQNSRGAGIKESFNCQSCVRRKIKCDRSRSKCSGCIKAKVDCVYIAPLPRKRKRTTPEDIHQRLARYEAILKENNLLPREITYSTEGTASHTTFSTREPSLSPNTQPVLKPRYIDHVLLLNDGEGDLCEVRDSTHNISGHDSGACSLDSLLAYAVSGTIVGSTQSLTQSHPTYDEAMKLWSLYTENVDPLCKILHTPTIAQMVEMVASRPNTATRADECLLFVVYYLAIFSVSDTQCLRQFHQPRNFLLSKYRTAVCQALVNAAWLKTTSIQVLQAYTLFLISLRTQIDPNTYWMLTGIAIRLAQRMGLHRGGEESGLSPFEVQMRRRLFWQILPLDSFASQASGVGTTITPDAWDTEPPLNINDDQLSADMTTQPVEQKGATDMIFCLSRLAIHNFYTRASVQSDNGGKIQFKDSDEIQKVINQVEDSLETRFLRYCDLLNPLHFLTSGMVRSATNAIRLRARMPLLLKESTTIAERKGLCTAAENILNSHSAIYNSSSLQKFRWHTQTFFIWDALLCILRCLVLPGVYSPSELGSTWQKVAYVYSIHDELVKGRRTLYATIGKLTVRAWLASPPTDCSSEPDFITTLRGQLASSVNGQSHLDLSEAPEAAFVDDVVDDDLFNFDDASFYFSTLPSFGALDWMSLDQVADS